jgi:hypothetical protein
MARVVLLRVGIDSGSGGIHGPLFEDGSFEYIPIPDGFYVDERTYGNSVGRHGRPLVEYFPPRRRQRMASQPMHVDPEFATFTYGDPTLLKSGLRHLQTGDLLVFYCGLRRWQRSASVPALYLLGYFEILAAGRACDFDGVELHMLFGENFHVRHPPIFARQRDHLVLVKGGRGSRLFREAVQISEVGRTRSGKPLKVLSQEMQRTFGSFGGQLSIQRSPPRWIEPAFVERAATLIRSLP